MDRRSFMKQAGMGLAAIAGVGALVKGVSHETEDFQPPEHEWPFITQYDNNILCDLCNKALQPGDDIHKVEGKRLVHDECLKALRYGSDDKLYITKLVKFSGVSRPYNIPWHEACERVWDYRSKYGVTYAYFPKVIGPSDSNKDTGLITWIYKRSGVVANWKPVRSGRYGWMRMNTDGTITEPENPIVPII